MAHDIRAEEGHGHVQWEQASPAVLVWIEVIIDDGSGRRTVHLVGYYLSRLQSEVTKWVVWKISSQND